MEITYAHKLVGLSQFINQLDSDECISVAKLQKVADHVHTLTHINDAEQDSEVIEGIAGIAFMVFDSEN